MPRYVARPIQVEAFRYTGNLSELPPSLIPFVPSAQTGGVAQVRVYYSPRTVDCEVGDYILRTMAGVAVVSESAFEMNYEEVFAGSDPIADAVARATYVGSPNADETKDHIDWLGHHFPLNKAVFIASMEVAERLDSHPFFRVEMRPSLAKMCEEIVQAAQTNTPRPLPPTMVHLDPDHPGDFEIVTLPDNESDLKEQDIDAGDLAELGGARFAQAGGASHPVRTAAKQRGRPD